MVSFPNVGIRALFGMLVFIAAMSALAGLVSLQERAQIVDSQQRSLEHLLNHNHDTQEHINTSEQNGKRIEEILERIETLELERRDRLEEELAAGGSGLN